MSVLTLKDVSYKYEGTNKYVLSGINMRFEAGKVYAIVGKSGMGKSTMLSLLAGLDVCTKGEIIYKDAILSQLDRNKYRAKDIGVIFQGYNLLTNATAIENVVLAMNISGNGGRDKAAKAAELLARVGINKEKAGRKVLKLSGGEQQRVAIARALSHDPDIIIADEPTGNLDTNTERDIIKIITSLAHENGKCVIIVTHSKKIAGYADETWGLNKGVFQHVSGGGKQ